MARITDRAYNTKAVSLYILASATTAPIDDDGNGYGGTNAGNSETINQVTNLLEVGDITYGEWETSEYDEYGTLRTRFLKTKRPVSEIEFALPHRPTEAGQAALIANYAASTGSLHFAIVESNGASTPDYEQYTFEGEIVDHIRPTSEMDTNAKTTFKVKIHGDIVNSARVTP